MSISYFFLFFEVVFIWCLASLKLLFSGYSKVVKSSISIAYIQFHSFSKRVDFVQSYPWFANLTGNLNLWNCFPNTYKKCKECKNTVTFCHCQLSQNFQLCYNSIRVIGESIHVITKDLFSLKKNFQQKSSHWNLEIQQISALVKSLQQEVDQLKMENIEQRLLIEGNCARKSTSNKSSALNGECPSVAYLVGLFENNKIVTTNKEIGDLEFWRISKNDYGPSKEFLLTEQEEFVTRLKEIIFKSRCAFREEDIEEINELIFKLEMSQEVLRQNICAVIDNPKPFVI